MSRNSWFSDESIFMQSLSERFVMRQSFVVFERFFSCFFQFFSRGSFSVQVMRAVRILRVIKVLRLVGMLRMAEDQWCRWGKFMITVTQVLWYQGDLFSQVQLHDGWVVYLELGKGVVTVTDGVFPSEPFCQMSTALQDLQLLINCLLLSLKRFGLHHGKLAKEGMIYAKSIQQESDMTTCF